MGTRDQEEGSGVAGSGGERHVIGFIAPNVHGYFFGSILAGVIDAATAPRPGVPVLPAVPASQASLLLLAQVGDTQAVPALP